MKIYNIKTATAFLLIFTTLLLGCKKFNDWQVDESYKRLFSPLGLTASIDGVTPTLRWNSTPGTEKYIIEISKDSLQFSDIVYTYETTGTTDANGRLFVVPDLLDAVTRYSARIKGESATVASSNWSVVTFQTRTEQIMYGVEITDLAPRAVTLRWMIPNAVTHFMINGTRYDITDAEKAGGVKTIEGLTPKTSYTATLYNNTSIRGTQTFTTKADIPTGNNVIEVGANDNFAAMLAAPIVPGTIFVLYQGSVYTTDSTIVLPENASFTIWGEDGPQKPVLAFNGITLPAFAGTIKFENLDITGYQNNDPAASTRNYLFNQSTASNTDEIIFENCLVRNFVNTPLRLQSSNPITIGKVTFNKATVYDIGNNGSNGTYALIHTNVSTGVFNNILLSNSTFYDIGYSIILHTGAASQSVVIENNTFYNVIGNGRYFIDYNARAITGAFQLNNNIIAKTLSPLNSARGIRAATTPSTANNYLTSDAVFSSNAIPGTASYSGTSADLFVSPTTGDFNIKDNAFAGASTAGDPRFRY